MHGPWIIQTEKNYIKICSQFEHQGYRDKKPITNNLNARVRQKANNCKERMFNELYAKNDDSYQLHLLHRDSQDFQNQELARQDLDFQCMTV